MTIALNYELDLDLSQRLFRQLQHAETEQLMDQLGHYMVQRTLERFDAEEAPGGESWEPSHRAQIEGGKTLQDSGVLRDSYTHNLVNDRQVEVGSNMLYAAIHHDGKTIKAKNAKALKFKVGKRWVQKASVDIPARPALGIDDIDENEMQLITEDFLEDLLNVN